jgi:hypothetical protein
MASALPVPRWEQQAQLWNQFHRAGWWFRTTWAMCAIYITDLLSGQPIRVSSLSPLGNWRLADDNRVSEPPISAGCRPKVSKADIEANEAEFAQHFKGAFSIGNVRVRSLPGQPAIPAFGPGPQKTRERAGNPGFSRVRLRLWTPKSIIAGRQSAKVSGHTREYSRFTETVGGDRVRLGLPPAPSTSYLPSPCREMRSVFEILAAGSRTSGRT